MSEVNLPATEPETRTIYFAGGCFWGTQRFMQLVPGVDSTAAGYANSVVPYPSYKDVCTGETGAAETVEVVYEADMVDLPTLISLYLSTIDPTSVNKQGGDIGTQYRTGIYYVDDNDKAVIDKALKEEAKKYKKPLAIEVMPLQNFYPAEDYHQDYLIKNPRGYCHIDSMKMALARNYNPKSYKKPSDARLRRTLSAEQYAVTQEGATEAPFTNRYWRENRPGIYVDVTTGQPLFASSDKFESGCGWPAFAKPIDEALITERADDSHGMHRVEVRASTSGAHLGHVFADGPSSLGGMRYCINSASLRFIPLELMDQLGYSSYKHLAK